MSEISRRNVARGAAWSIPAVAVAGAAPALAGSQTPQTPKDPGLQGRVWWTRNCNDRQLTITPAPSNGELYPAGDYGFYVFDAQASDVSNACMTFRYSSLSGAVTWHAASNNGAWTVPVPVSGSGGSTTYQSCYTGTFVDRVNGSTHYASVTSYPSFYASLSSCPSSTTITITRTVSVKGQVISFGRTVSV